ncbi:hypothetical protein PIB30_072440, partial [Stylosanthes scabra]|nr:hypothetical protein [Stylosanthes scabra]
MNLLIFKKEDEQQHRRVEENLQYLERPEPPTAPRIWSRHHGSSLLDDGRRDTEWEAASRRLQGGDGGRDDFNLQCGRLRQFLSAKGAARTVEQGWGSGRDIGDGGVRVFRWKRMRKEEILSV